MDVDISIFTKTLCIAVAFTNDMKHIHLHASGNQFDRIHSIAGEYYDVASDDSDYLSELALEYNMSVPNFSTACSFIEWSPESEEAYDFESCISSLSNKIYLYVTSLEELRNSPEVGTDVQSKLDDTIRWWKKERDYKTKKRASVGIDTSQFVDTGVDVESVKYIRHMNYMRNQLNNQ